MSQCKENKSDRGPDDLPKSHTLLIPEGCWESRTSPQSINLMHLMGSTPTQQCKKCLEKGSFVLSASYRCVASMAALPGDFSPQFALRRSNIVCLGPLESPFQEFGHNRILLIYNNCHCSVVMHQSSSHMAQFL